jgi:hypothetical protein
MCNSQEVTHRVFFMNHKHEVDITKNDSRDYSVVCHYCGHTFEAARSDAAFCSASCRVANSREPAKERKQLALFEGFAAQLVTFCKKHRYNQTYFEVVKRIHATVSHALSQFEQV